MINNEYEIEIVDRRKHEHGICRHCTASRREGRAASGLDQCSARNCLMLLCMQSRKLKGKRQAEYFRSMVDNGRNESTVTSG